MAGSSPLHSRHRRSGWDIGSSCESGTGISMSSDEASGSSSAKKGSGSDKGSCVGCACFRQTHSSALSLYLTLPTSWLLAAAVSALLCLSTPPLAQGWELPQRGSAPPVFSSRLGHNLRVARPSAFARVVSSLARAEMSRMGGSLNAASLSSLRTAFESEIQKEIREYKEKTRENGTGGAAGKGGSAEGPGDGLLGDAREGWRRKGFFRGWGGPILWQPVKLYVVYVGDWSAPGDACAPRVVKDLLTSLTNSTLRMHKENNLARWWDVAREYWQDSSTGRRHVADRMTYSPGQNTYYFKNLPKAVTMKYMEKLARQRLPSLYKKAGGIVLFLFGRGVNVVEEKTDILCNAACGFHYGHRTMQRHGFVYAVNPTICANKVACNPNPLMFSKKYGDKPPYPNNCPSADAMASVLLHEVAEAASNLLGRDVNLKPGWLCGDFKANCECGDVCDLSSVMPFNEDCAHAAANQARGSPEAVAFGASRAAPNGACYNVVGSNGQRFLVQPLPSTTVIQKGTKNTLACVMQH